MRFRLVESWRRRGCRSRRAETSSSYRLPTRISRRGYGNELIPAGSIIVRQRGTRFHAGENVGMGKDHTLFAKVDGYVEFSVKGALKRQTVSVRPYTGADE